jgi:hypothetical protein
MQLLPFHCIHEGVNEAEMFFESPTMNESVIEENYCVIRQQVASFCGMLRHIGVDARYGLQNSTEQALRDCRTGREALGANVPLELTKTRGERCHPRVFIS